MEKSELLKRPAEADSNVSWPRHVTFAWAWHNVPGGIWASLVGAFIAVFLAGISFGRSDAYAWFRTTDTTSAKPTVNQERSSKEKVPGDFNPQSSASVSRAEPKSQTPPEAPSVETKGDCSPATSGSRVGNIDIRC